MGGRVLGGADLVLTHHFLPNMVPGWFRTFAIHLLLLWSVGRASQKPLVLTDSRQAYAHSIWMDGDIILGGLFPVHTHGEMGVAC